MNNTVEIAKWEAPSHAPALDEYDLARWRQMTALAAEYAEAKKWSKQEFVRQSGVPSGTFFQWFDGNYGGSIPNITARVEKWLHQQGVKLPGPGDEAASRRVKAAAEGAWSPWALPQSTPDLADEELERWKRLTEECRAVAEVHQFTKAEVSRRSDVPSGTFSPWYDGTYTGVVKNVSDRVERWLISLRQMTEAAAKVPAAPEFIQTPTSKQIVDALLYAQVMSEMVIITLGAGMGKTITIDHYRRTNPHVYVATMRPTTKGAYNMIKELARVLEVHERDPARLDSALGEALKRNGRRTLLIIDEAQNLQDDAVNQLRHYLDVYGVGIALIGNEELYSRFGGQRATPSYAQIHRRIGKRLRRLQPLAGDIEALIDAWGVADKEIRRLLRTIGRKDGALGQITKTMQLAGMYAAGEGRAIEARDIVTAWENRGAETLR